MTVNELVNTNKKQVDTQQSRPVTKRAIPVIIGDGLAFYAISNLVMSLFSVKYIAMKTEQQIELENINIKKFDRTLMATKTIQEGIINTTESLASKLKDQERAIERLTILLPSIAWRSTQLHSSITRAALKLREIKYEYMYNRLNTIAAGSLWNTTEFSMLRPEDTLLEEITQASNRTLLLE